MLQDSDLKSFISAFEASSAPGIGPAQPRSILSKDDGLFPSEIWRLVSSLQIAAVLGDSSQTATAAARVIFDDVRDLRCTPLSDQRAWAQAIAWALAQPAFSDPTALEVPLGRERDRVVGAACSRLRERGYTVEVGAYGPQISESSRRELVRSVEALVDTLGGLQTASQVLRYLRDVNFFHDGMWLFGEVGLNLYDDKRPMIPVGWLFSLALRKLGRPGGAHKPEVAWKSLVDLATDFAAAQDCQRYNQFEGVDLHASQLHRTLTTSILWRELFTLPQMPPKALEKVLDALVTKITPDDEEKLGFSTRALIKEILQLLEWSATDRMTIFPRTKVEESLPTLRRLSGGAADTVNLDYGDPLAASGRTQDGIILFALGQDQAITLPCAFLATAACNFIFELIWSKLGKRAETVVGKTLEHAIEGACRSKASTVLASCEYTVGGDRFEFDVSVRDQDRIVLIETKGKMLTRQSRSGDMFKFFEDYSDSFLRMLSQLVRHEHHLRQGHTPLTIAYEATGDLRPIKVAVSPLSYGPVSDKMLSNNLIRSLINTRLMLVTPHKGNQRIIDEFNRRAESVIGDMVLLAPRRDGLAHLFPFLIDVFWLDLGQLLYILDRANTVWDAFTPLKHITFSSRDFWTELAHADRSGLTAGKWRQIT